MQRIILYSILILNLFSCGQDNRPIKKTKAEMIVQAEKIITRNGNLPSKILDAQFVEFQQGDGRLGPSEFQFYMRITVNKVDTKKWVSGLEKPFNNSGVYSKPNTNEAWWITEYNFLKIEKFETKTLFNRYNGWICIDEDLGFIYVYTFTM